MSNLDPLDTRGQKQAEALREQRAKLAAQIESEDIKWLMSSKRGRRIVWRLLERAGVYRTSFNTNALTMAFNEGVRNEGLRLVAQLNTSCPGHYTTMLAEREIE